MIDPMATSAVKRGSADQRRPRGREASSTHPPAYMDASPFARPSTRLTGRALLRPEACFRPNQPVHRGGCRVTREGRNAVKQPRLRGLTRCPTRWLPSATFGPAARSGAARTFRCGGNRLHSYIRPVRAGTAPAGPDGISTTRASSLLRASRPAREVRLGGSRSDLFAITPSRSSQPPGGTSCASCRPSPPALRRAGPRSSGCTPGHGPTRPMPSARSCSRAPPRRRSAGDGWPAATATAAAPSRW